MASVQIPPPVQHPGAPMPTGATKQQAEEVFRKLKQMKESGVPPNDPEYIKASQFLLNFQQQHHMRRNQQQYIQAQQQMQQNAQAVQNGNANGVNGTVNGVQRPQQGVPQTTQAAALPNAMGTAAAASNTSATTTPNTPAQPNSSTSSSHFTTKQLGLLRQQIHAFKLLGKNAGISVALQQAIFQQRQQRQAAVTTSAQTAAASKTPQPGSDATKPTPNGVDAAAAQDDALSLPKPHTYKTVKSPYGSSMIRPSIKYFDHAQRKNRWFIPGVFPTGIDFDHLRYEREVVVFNRMSQRYSELKNLPANIAHWDTTKENVEVDDSVKVKAVIEMKSLALYAKQRALREKIARQMMHYDNLAMTTNRTNYRRMKKQNVR